LTEKLDYVICWSEILLTLFLGGKYMFFCNKEFQRVAFFALLAVFSLGFFNSQIFAATEYSQRLSSLLAEMEARKSQREVEAQKFHLSLPSVSQDHSQSAPKPIFFPTPEPQNLPIFRESQNFHPSHEPQHLTEEKPGMTKETEPSSAIPEYHSINQGVPSTTSNLNFISEPFSSTLARFTAKRAAREKEAKKMGIILPSKGGSISTVSPSLAKLNDSLNKIIQRLSGNSSLAGGMPSSQGEKG